MKLVDRLKGIIFDLDDTLVKTRIEYVIKAVNFTLQELEYKREASKEECCLFWYGTNRSEKIREMWKVDPNSFWKIFKKYDTVKGRMENTVVYEDIKALESLDDGLKKGILTSSTREIALAEKSLIDSYFNVDGFIVANIFENIKEKPEPDGIYEFLKLFNIKADDIVMVGDSESDVLAAQAANVLDILVERDTKRLRGCKPSIIIKSLYDLLNLEDVN